MSTSSSSCCSDLGEAAAADRRNLTPAGAVLHQLTMCAKQGAAQQLREPRGGVQCVGDAAALASRHLHTRTQQLPGP